MRTTLTLDEDVAALIRSERERTGESFRDTVNRLIRNGTRPIRRHSAPSLPTLPGAPILDVSDVSAVLAALDDDRRAERGLV